MSQKSKTDKSGSSRSKNKDGGAHEQQTGSVNSDDEIVCHSCQKVFTDPKAKLMECERCMSWFCQTCGDITDTEYKALSGKSSKMHWYCERCNDEAVSAVKTSNLIEEKCRQYTGEMKEELRQELKGHIDTELGLVKEELLRVKEASVTHEKFQSLKAQVEEKLHSSADFTIKEVQERQERRLNLVVFNAEESSVDDAEQRKKEDLDKLRSILSKLGENVPLANPTRLGTQNPTSIRPLRVRTSCEQDLKNILRVSSRLRGDDLYSSVYINRDMTPLERDQWKKLVIEKKTRNNAAREAGEDAKWIIRNYQVVKERPQRDNL